MLKHIKTTAWTIFLIALFVGLWKLNIFFGRRTGEIDQGSWYAIQGASGQYYMKGIDPDNEFADYKEMEEEFSKTPVYKGTEHAFGAIWLQRRWTGDAVCDSSGWNLFTSEVDAVKFLKENGVAENNIYFRYK